MTGRIDVPKQEFEESIIPVIGMARTSREILLLAILAERTPITTNHYAILEAFDTRAEVIIKEDEPNARLWSSYREQLARHIYAEEKRVSTNEASSTLHDESISLDAKIRSE